MKSVRFHHRAESEMLGARDFYNAQLDDLGENFIDEVERSIAIIQKSPTRWPIMEENFRGYILQRFPFTIYYVNDPDDILILAIAHQSRNPGYWKTR